MEFVAKIFVETAATMLLLALVNGAGIASADLNFGIQSFDLALDESPPAIPAEYYSDYQSPLQEF